MQFPVEQECQRSSGVWTYLEILAAGTMSTEGGHIWGVELSDRLSYSQRDSVSNHKGLQKSSSAQNRNTAYCPLQWLPALLQILDGQAMFLVHVHVWQEKTAKLL